MARAQRSRRPPWGQHFLADARLRQRILELLGPRPRDFWLEIGAGHGEIALGLAARSLAVVAVERDPQLAAELRENLACTENTRVLEMDILEVEVAALAREASGGRLRVYGSLPYYITSPILSHLYAAMDALEDIQVIVQLEVAHRLTAGPGRREYGFLSVLTQLHAEPEILLRVPRGAFRPQPKVDSALVCLTPSIRQAHLGIADLDGFVEFVAACFQHKRKTLRNNLKGQYSASRVGQATERAGLGPRARAEELSVEELARLYKQLQEPESP